MSRIVIWSPAYAPELLGIAPIVTEAAEWLVRRGHTVTVHAPLPNNPHRVVLPEYRGRAWLTERRNAVDVHRAWLRVRPAETFADKALWEVTYVPLAAPAVVRSIWSADVFVCVVPSLLAAVAGATAARAVRRTRGHPRFVLWVQDLVLEAAGSVPDMTPRKEALLAGVRRGELFAARTADQIVVCSPGFGAYFARYGVRTPVTTVLNWVDVGAHPASAPPNGRTRFVYAGNLGYTQGLETLIEAAELVGPSVEVDIVGGGNSAQELRRSAERVANVSVRPSVPPAEFPGLLESAHALVLIQRRASAGVNFPSKTGPYLASGRPVLASLDDSVPAADVLRASGGALLVPAEDPAALAAAMRRLRDEPGLRAELGFRGRRYAEEELSRDLLLPRLEEALVGPERQER